MVTASDVVGGRRSPLENRLEPPATLRPKRRSGRRSYARPSIRYSRSCMHILASPFTFVNRVNLKILHAPEVACNGLPACNLQRTKRMSTHCLTNLQGCGIITFTTE